MIDYFEKILKLIPRIRELDPERTRRLYYKIIAVLKE